MSDNAAPDVPPLTRRQQLSRRVQRTFHDRKEAYIGALEQGALGMKQGSDRIIKERDAFAEENERLKSICTTHGIEYDIGSPSGTANAKEPEISISQSLFSYSRQRLLKTSFAAKSKLRVRSYAQYRTGNVSAIKGKFASQVGGVNVSPQNRKFEGGLASFSAESSFTNIEQRRCLDNLGQFVSLKSLEPDQLLEGRVRQVICPKYAFPHSRNDRVFGDGFSINESDFMILERAFELHPATLQYSHQVMTASKFWDNNLQNLSIILSFPSTPKARLDFISLTYNSTFRCTRAFVGDSSGTVSDVPGSVEEYDTRMDESKDFWAHPFVLIIIMLDMQLAQLNHGVSQNNRLVSGLESQIGKLIDPDKASRSRPEQSNITRLMEEAHTALKGSIKMVDAINWMSRAVDLLIEAGCELDATQPPGSYLKKLWLHVEQYLKDTHRLCESLRADPQMSEKRCQAQIDILYSKMAQEDNMLNFSIAVASSRDNSSMKALAVITALFLPGTYMATLFSMTMFNWQNDTHSAAISSGEETTSRIVMPMFWVYWVLAIPLTLIVVISWRSWATVQDRDFRKTLPEGFEDTVLEPGANEKKELPTTFLQDFFHLRRRRRIGKPV